MKAAIVGCGAVASRWIRVLNNDPRIEITALIDPDQQAAGRLAERYRLSVEYAGTLEQALRAYEFDVAVNLTPVDAHAPISRIALDAGRDVLSEKPLAVCVNDALELVALARRRGRVLAVMQNRGQDPQFLAFRDLVRRNMHGPFAVSAEVFVDLPVPGFRTAQVLPATSDLTVHAFDQIRELIPAPPTTLHCSERPLDFLDRHCALTVVLAEFADGSVFSYRGGYTAGRGLRTAANGRWHIQSREVAAHWNGASTAAFGTSAGDNLREVALPKGLPGYQTCITAMIDMLHGAEQPSCLAADNLGSIALLEAALTSATTAQCTAVPSISEPGHAYP